MAELLKRGFDPNLRHKFRKNQPIHAAVKHAPTLRAILSDSKTDVTATDLNDSTVLHLLVQEEGLSAEEKVELLKGIFGEAGFEEKVDAPEAVGWRTKLFHGLRRKADREILLSDTYVTENYPKNVATSAKQIVNAKDNLGNTALWYAANLKQSSVVATLCKNGASVIVDCGGETIEKFLRKQQLWKDVYRQVPFSAYQKPSEDLWQQLKSGELTKLQKSGGLAKYLAKVPKEVLNLDLHGETLLCYACSDQQGSVAIDLIEAGADPTRVLVGGRNALAVACKHGMADVVRKICSIPRLTGFVNVYDETGSTPVIHVLRRRYGRYKGANYSACLDILLSMSGINLNVTDKVDNTPLHYAVTSWPEDTVQLLLKRGALMFVPNQQGDLPLDKMSLETVEVYLDSLVKTTQDSINGPKDSSMRADFSGASVDALVDTEEFLQSVPEASPFTVTMDYSFLFRAEGKKEQKYPETTCLYRFVKSKTHQSILRHILIRTFLHLKWQRMLPLFFCNCLLYGLYLVFLFAYLIWGAHPAMLCASTESNCPIWTESSPEGYFHYLSPTWSIIGYILLALNVVVLLLEVLQFFISPSKYLLSLENMAEIVMIVAVFVVCFVDDLDTAQLAGAVALLFSLSEVTRMCGQMPYFAVYVKMFTTILAEICRFLAYYAFLLFVFASCFRFLFYPSSDAFHTSGAAMLKTVAMLTGELDFADLPLNSVLSSFVFLTFVFSVTIVLANLLTALAIGEVQEIRKNAEILGFAAEIKLIYYMEAMLLRDPDGIFQNYSFRDAIVRKLRNSTFGQWAIAHWGSKFDRSKYPKLLLPCCSTIYDFVPGSTAFLDALLRTTSVFTPPKRERKSEKGLPESQPLEDGQRSEQATRKIVFFPREDIQERVEGNYRLTLSDEMAEDVYQEAKRLDA